MYSKNPFCGSIRRTHWIKELIYTRFCLNQNNLAGKWGSHIMPLMVDKLTPSALSSCVARELGLCRHEKVRVSTAVGVGSCRQLEQHSMKPHNV